MLHMAKLHWNLVLIQLCSIFYNLNITIEQYVSGVNMCLEMEPHRSFLISWQLGTPQNTFRKLF